MRKIIGSLMGQRGKTLQIWNEKTVNDLHLRALLFGADNWNATDFLLLAAIASDCPLMGGDAVFKAHSL